MLPSDLSEGAVIGVDTHKHSHTAAALSRTGVVIESLTVTADPAGYRQLIAFGERHQAHLWAIEGTGSYGAGLTAALADAGQHRPPNLPPPRSAPCPLRNIEASTSA